jgi:HK97 family phage major capsid protein
MTTTSKTDFPAVPTTPEELAEIVGDDKASKALFGGTAAQRQEWFLAYNKIVNKGDAIGQQVTEQVSATMIDWLKENGGPASRPDMTELAGEIKAAFGPTAPVPPAGGIKSYNPNAMGASLDDDFADSREYFKSIWHYTDPSEANNAQLSRLRNAFSEGVPSEGGFLVPERLRANLLSVGLESAVVRPRARVIPMDSLRVPFPTIDSTSNSSTVFGGIVGYWTEEAATLAPSQAAFGRLVLDAKKLTTYTTVSNELVQDSAISFQAFIDEIFPEALSFYEDDAFINGTGVGEPKGFLNGSAVIEITKETGQAAATIVWENVIKMYSRMLPSSLNRAVWVASPDTFPQLATMAQNVGTGGSAIWLNNGASGPPVTILGRPLIFTEKAKTVGTAGDLSLVDFGFYLIGDRQVMTAKSSEHVGFAADTTAFRIIERVDGRPWLETAITPKNSGDTVSPFVTIATRA